MSRPAFPGFALSLGALWLLTGALYKLFEGSPNDMPPLVVEKSPFDMWETFRYAIMVELAVVGLVFSVPRIGWVFLAGTFVTFLTVLVPLVLEGEESCGCFGSNVKIDPIVMMSIDAGLLLLLLSSKPWRLPKDSGLGWGGLVPFLVLAVAGPFLKLEGSPELPARKAPAPTITGDPTGADSLVDTAQDAVETVADAADAAASDLVNAATDAEPAPEEEPRIEDVEVSDNGEVDAPADVASDLPPFYELRWQEWAGKDFIETDLFAFADQSNGAVMPNSHVVVYRQTCEVCKEHLEKLWEETQTDPQKWQETSLVLLRIIETKDTDQNNVCTLLPEPSEKVTLPALKRGYGITTPLTFDVDDNYLVENVLDVRALTGKGGAPPGAGNEPADDGESSNGEGK